MSDEIAERIREELGRRRLTRQWLADAARISLSTLEKGLAGQRPFTTATLVRIEEALGLVLRAPRPEPGSRAGIAGDELGGYARQAVRWLEGDYLTVRPAFAAKGALLVYRTSIFWDDVVSNLVFREAERADAAYAQRGDVALAHQSGHIYLITREAGQFRLAIVSRPTIDRALHGLLATLHAGPASSLTPVCCPIALLPLTSPQVAPFGLLPPGAAGYGVLARCLAAVETDGFVRLISAPRADACPDASDRRGH